VIRIACVDVDVPLVVLPRASVGPHSTWPVALLEDLNATRNDESLVSQTEGPRVRLCAGRSGQRIRRRKDAA
jgi:hypothetical protein